MPTSAEPVTRPPLAAPGGGAPMRACSASSSSVAGRSVRWMAKLQPSLSVSARISARWLRDARLVIRLPGLGAAGRDRAAAFRLDELDAAGIREGLLRRIDDLHGVAVRAGRRELRERLRAPPRSGSRNRKSPRSRRAPTARTQPAGSRAGSTSWMMAFAILSSTLRLPVGRIRPGMPTRSPACTSTSASAKAMTSVRSSLDSCASGDLKSIDGERSGQIQTVCAASHSCSRT